MKSTGFRYLVPLFIAAAFLLPSSAQGATFRIVFHNATNSDVKLVGTDNNCWYPRNLDPGNAIEVNPGQTGLLFTEDKNSGSCYFSSNWQNLELVFKGSDGKYPSPYNGAVGRTNAAPYTRGGGGWDLSASDLSVSMRNRPEGPLPINPAQAGSQSNTNSKGMFCVVSSQGEPSIIRLTLRPGTDCYGPAKTRKVSDRGVKPARPGPSSGKTDTQTVFDLFQIGKAACDLTRPSQAWAPSGCEEINVPAKWDLHNVKNDVTEAKSTSDARVIGSWTNIAQSSFSNNTDGQGKQEWEYSYKKGDETSTETESGWKVGGKLEWAKKFGLRIIGQFEQTLEVSLDHEWSTKEEQKHSVEKEVKQSAEIEAEPHHKTTMVVKQNQATVLTSFSAKLTAGTKGMAEPIQTPGFRSLGFSAARNQPCLAMLAGNSPNSLMGLAAYARGQGYSPESVGIPEDQRAFLEAAQGLSISDAQADRCPGYPSGYPAFFAFEGTASYKGQAAGPTSADSFAPRLPEIEICAYSEPLPTPAPHPHAEDAVPNDACHQGSKPPLNEYGTIIQGDQAPAGTVEGDDGGSLIYADESAGGAPRGNDPRTYQGADGEDIIVGGKFDERLLGGDEQDILRGEEGNDQLDGQAGPDSLFGGPGNDSLSDNEGDNALFGGEGNDHLSSSANARGGLLGGPGKDILLMKGNGPVTLLGGPGDDRFRLLDGARGRGVTEMPNQGFDTVLTDRSLTLTPYVERVVATGSKGVHLRAGDGDQRLVGSSGADKLVGGTGSDLLRGGKGNDLFVLQPFGFDLAIGGPGADRFRILDRNLGASRVGSKLPARSKSAHLIKGFNPRQGDRLELPVRSFGTKLKAWNRHRVITRSSKPKGTKPQMLIGRGRNLLSFDPDGKGGNPARVIAIVKGKISKKTIRVIRR